MRARVHGHFMAVDYNSILSYNMCSVNLCNVHTSDSCVMCCVMCYFKYIHTSLQLLHIYACEHVSWDSHRPHSDAWRTHVSCWSGYARIQKKKNFNKNTPCVCYARVKLCVNCVCTHRTHARSENDVFIMNAGALPSRIWTATEIIHAYRSCTTREESNSCERNPAGVHKFDS